MYRRPGIKPLNKLCSRCQKPFLSMRDSEDKCAGCVVLEAKEAAERAEKAKS